MNIIPTTFNENQIPYTILGQSDSNINSNISVLILNRGARYYLSSLFKNLNLMGLNNIVYIDRSHHSFEIEALSNQFPDIKFILPDYKITTGDMINLGMGEISSEFVLVFWSDMYLADHFLNQNLISKLEEQNTLCISPFLIDKKNNKLPVQIVPSVENMDFSTEQFLVRKDFTKTIYPFDFAGIYKREKFIEIGGFDYTIKNPYWQNLDFGFRANLWSYNILISNVLKLKYSGDFPIEDISADDSYLKFYLKNLAIDVGEKGGFLPGNLFFGYAKKSGVNPIKAYKQFSLAREWVKINRAKFKKSPHKLISDWEPVL